MKDTKEINQNKENNIIYLKQSELKDLREKILKKNNYICPICERKISIDEAVVDHIHGSHKSLYPETNKLIRNVICRTCNIILGKIENIYIRSPKEYKEQVDLEKILQNISIYINTYKEKNNFDMYLVHPTEWKPKKIKKSSFNKLKKLVKEKYNKELVYPKSGKLTKQIEEYANELDFELEYY